MKNFKSEYIVVIFLFLAFGILMIFGYSQINQISSELEDQNSFQESIKNEYERKIQDLENQVNSLHDDNSNLIIQYYKLEKKNKKLKEENQRLQEELDSIRAPYDQSHITNGSRVLPESSDMVENQNYKNNRTVTIDEILNMDLRTLSLATVYEIDSFLQGTNMEGLGKFYIDAQRYYGVSAIFLMSKDIMESGYGSSNLAITRYNLSGYKAYDEDPYNAKIFDSFEHCIDEVSAYVKNEYLTEDGKYYNGYTLEAVNKRYASDTEWANKIANKMLQFDTFAIELAASEELNIS